MASPAFSAIGTLTSHGQFGTITRPAVSEGDLMIWVVSVNAASGAVETPTDWTLLDSVDNGSGFNSCLYTFWKVAGASEPSTYSITLDTSFSGQSVIASWAGADGTTPINAHGSQLNGTSSTNVACPSVTTTVADTTLVCVYVEAGGSFPTATFTPDAAQTERLDQKLSSRPPISLADEAVAASGATGTRTAVASSSMKTAVISFAIAPSGASGAFTLSAASGSFSETGKAATLKAARKLAASVASFTLTGKDAALTGPGAKTLTAAAGSFTLTGQDIGLEVAVPAGLASFTLTGQAATLTYTPFVPNEYTLAAALGIYALTGIAAVMAAPRRVSIMGTTQLAPPVNQVWVTYAEDEETRR